ncbi:MAG: hypothetical protein AAGA56_09210, partial [Myxococcota bacterium]
RESGLVVSQNLVVPSPRNTVSRLLVEPIPTNCGPLERDADGTFPIAVDFYRTDLPPGIETSLVTRETDASTLETAAVRAQVAAGTYDIHLRPLTDLGDDTTDGPCLIPPVVLPQRVIESSDDDFEIDIQVRPPTMLNGTVVGFNATGWTVDIVENSRGLRVSTRDTIETPGERSTFAVSYYPDVLEAGSVEAIVRLQPPENMAAAGMPLLLWNLGGLTILDDEVTLDLSVLAEAELVTIEPQVVDPETGEGVFASVVIQSEQLLDGGIGGNAVFKAVVNTDEAGRFSAQLLPGSYVFVAQTDRETYADATTTFSIDATDLPGRTISLGRSQPIVGQALTAGGQPVLFSPVSLEPPPADAMTYLQRTLLVAELQPRAEASLTDEAGNFQLAGGAGAFNLLVKPESDLPWGLLTDISVVSGTTNAPLNVTLTNPVVMGGLALSAEGQGLAGATIRAYVQTTGSGTLVPIGQSTADETGAYQLPLPSTLP